MLRSSLLTIPAVLAIMACGTEASPRDVTGATFELIESPAPPVPATSVPRRKWTENQLPFRRGLNFGNRLDAPSEGSWDAPIRPIDAKLVKSRGFDHVRLPIRFAAHAENQPPYTVEPAFMKRVKEVVDGLLVEQLGVIIDIHHYDALISAPRSHAARFVAIWEQIGQQFSTYPGLLAFELLNEPNGNADVTWNALAREALTAVRKSNPDRFVIIQAPNWGRPDSLDRATAASGRALELPSSDPNVIAGVHLYEPLLFTFQGDPYMGPQFSTVGIQFPGPPSQPLVAAPTVPSSADWVESWLLEYSQRTTQDNPSGAATIEKAFRQIQDYRTRTNIPVYVSEWGSNDSAEPKSRSNFTIAMRDAFARYNVGWAYWDNGANMRLLDRATNQWAEPLTTELLENKSLP